MGSGGRGRFRRYLENFRAQEWRRERYFPDQERGGPPGATTSPFWSCDLRDTITADAHKHAWTHTHTHTHTHAHRHTHLNGVPKIIILE